MYLMRRTSSNEPRQRGSAVASLLPCTADRRGPQSGFPYRWKLLFTLLAPLFVSWATICYANDESSKETALSIRQQRALHLLNELERKFTTLANSLEATEPERAERLIRALQESKRLLLSDRMDSVTGLLLEDTVLALDQATDQQQELIQDLMALLEILLSEKKSWQEVEDEIRRLRVWRAEVNALLRAERQHRRDTHHLENRDQIMQDLDTQIAALESLIGRQEKLLEQTSAARDRGATQLNQIADAQRQLRGDTGQLLENIRESDQPGEATGDADQDDASATDPPPNTPTDDSAPSPPETAPSDDESTLPLPPGEAPPSAPSKPSLPPPAAPPLERAMEAQQRAEQRLDAVQSIQAEKEEQAALEALQEALQELKQQRSRIAELNPESFDPLAEAQRQTEEKTQRLAEDIQNSDPAGGSSSEGATAPGEQTPNGKSVQQAGRAMQQASEQLDQRQAGAAAESQDDAIQNLQEALRELEDRLAQLREEMQIEKLARLEARFAEMLARQQEISEQTSQLHLRRQEAKRLTRSDRLGLARIEFEETELVDMASAAHEVIVADGTSVVFPIIVEQMKESLISVVELLVAQRTTTYQPETEPQIEALQNEIEQTLEELIEALQRAQEQRSGGGGGAGGGGESGDAPLLPGSAELKLLRSAQNRVNQRTVSLQEVAGGEHSAELLSRQLSRLADQQEQIARMTEEMLQRP